MNLFQAAGQMEITLELKYKFEGDPFELREHAVKFDLTNRALGGPNVSEGFTNI